MKRYLILFILVIAAAQATPGQEKKSFPEIRASRSPVGRWSFRRDDGIIAVMTFERDGTFHVQGTVRNRSRGIWRIQNSFLYCYYPDGTIMSAQFMDPHTLYFLEVDRTLRRFG